MPPVSAPASVDVPRTAEALAAIGLDEWQAILAGDPEVAFRWLSAAAEIGDADAQAVVGQWLLEGRGTAVDQSLARAWFDKAAAQGHAMAINMAGRCYEHGWGTPIKLSVAAQHYERAAAMGLHWAMYNLANLLAAGLGVRKDRQAALALYRQAVDKGNARSMNTLGRYLEEGIECEVDIAAARQWYARSAELGDFRGQFSHATVLISDGRVDEALTWLERMREKATPAFLEKVADALATSESEPLRRFAERLQANALRPHSSD